ncbi:MAG: hypothetical protein SXQ77_07930, partial [Halobacteria archaeon]|nr:hypothetical protein [Halobacteria archaeon]
MKFPQSENVREYESSIEAAHSEAQRKLFDGSLVVSTDGESEGVIVYLGGYPIYAYYIDGTDDTDVEEFHSENAVERLTQKHGEIQRHDSDADIVRMFHTYMEYLGRDENLINVYEKARMKVREKTVLVTRDATLDKVSLPEGERVGYAPSAGHAEKFARKHGFTGYAVSNNEVVFFRDGRT